MQQPTPKLSKWLTYSLTLIAVLSLSACATTAKYQAHLNQWHGQSIDNFVQVWGYPNKILKLENNQTAYLYSDRKIVSTPTTQMPSSITTVQSGDKTTVVTVPGTIVGGQTYSLSCVTWIVFNNKTKKIVNTTFRGNNCVSY